MTDHPRPTRLLTALLTAAAVALAAQAPAPAAASNDDLARILAGAAGVAILVGILESNRRAQAAAKPTPQAHVRPRPHHPPAHARPQPHRPPAQPQRPHRPVVLPASCAIHVAGRGRSGGQVLFGARCLQQAGIAVQRLPRRCAVELRGPRGTRPGFDGACLQQAGYRVHRR